MTTTAHDIAVIQAAVDERLATAACALNPLSPAGIALDEVRTMLPDIFRALTAGNEVMVKVGDMLAVAEEHTA